MSLLGSDIDELKGIFSKRQGLANSNRFMVYMQPPSGSLLNLDLNALAVGVLSGNGLSLGGLINDPRDVAMLCESCTLPGRAITTIDMQNVKQSIKVPYTYINEDVTFTFLLTNDYYMRKMFDQWMGMVFNIDTYTMNYKSEYVTDVRIAQLNKQNIPIYTVRLENAYPTGINAINLDNNAENSIQKVTVNLTYENFVVEGLVDTVTGIAGGIADTVAGTFRL
jgi:hypothetical protein